MTPTMTPPPQVQRQLATRTHGKRIALIVLVIIGSAIGGAVWLFATRGPMTPKATMTPGTRPWMSQAATYPDPDKPVEKAPVAPVDTVTPELARLRNELLAMKLKLEELEKRKSQTTVINQGQQGQGQVKPPEKRPAPMLFYHKDMQDKAAAAPAVQEYVLAPGATKFPCVVETAINSDVEGYFTAKVSTNVYDTATGRHLLVPQNSTILGHDQSAALLYGNERLPTISLTLALPDGRSVDLGPAPVTDQQGVAGLTGRVNNHYGRLFAAVFIGGALRGGMQALQSSMAQAGGVGQVAAGIGSFGNQVVSQRAGRALDTRPTIEVDAGQLCNVLLTKPLHLPAMWQ
jgi:type IV secretory pathway VirB10-like protein